jgi:hypothetical protein
MGECGMSNIASCRIFNDFDEWKNRALQIGAGNIECIDYYNCFAAYMRGDVIGEWDGDSESGWLIIDGNVKD